MKSHPSAPHYVYRIYGQNGRLLYVGMTADLCRRLQVHRRRSTWWAEATGGTAVQHHDIWTARLGEAVAIADETPAHNRDRRITETQRSQYDRASGGFRAPGATAEVALGDRHNGHCPACRSTP